MATFVLVHGSMHGGWCWKKVAPLLRAVGHEVYTPSLTGLGERVHLARPDIDLDTHIADIANLLAFEELTGVVLVGHSYAGSVITGVADRVPERIAHLVYLDAVVVSDGQAALDLWPPEGQATLRGRVEAEGEGWRLLPPADLAFWGLTDVADAAWAGGKVVPQPFKTFTQPIRLAHPSALAGPKTLIACTDTPPERWRDAAVARARTEPGWRYRELPTGHDAMVTMPRETADLLLEVAALPEVVAAEEHSAP
jgi:pimeloyl-ACP methyl ester carboxylesterase